MNSNYFEYEHLLIIIIIYCTRILPNWQPGRQQDAHEFLLRLLENISNTDIWLISTESIETGQL